MVEEHKFHEFGLADGQIDELIEKLEELKDSKEHFHFDLNEDEELFVKHKKRSFG